MWRGGVVAVNGGKFHSDGRCVRWVRSDGEPDVAYLSAMRSHSPVGVCWQGLTPLETC
jgi:hypothetical protein